MSEKLKDIYELRFSGFEKYRNQVWQELIEKFFCRWISPSDQVLDLGCGYGEFINNLKCSERHAMDLNPNVNSHLHREIIFHEQDCAQPWSIKDGSIDLIFTSNFFEHLPNKEALSQTVKNAHRCLKKNGKIIAMGPNISLLKGKYWDFWDHHIPLSDQSISELLRLNNFQIETSIASFLPYNMVRVKRKPLILISLYLNLPIVWKLMGKQFFIVARK